MRVRLRLSTASLIALVPGAALRIYPIHRPYLGLELQEMFPKNAIIALVHGDWRPFGLHQGSALLDLLRALISVWYAAGRLLGVYHDRLDVFAAFVRSPLPFVILGRVVVCSASIASLWLVGIAGASLFGELSGTAAILIHARETIELLRAQSRIMFQVSGGMSLRVLVGAGIGWATLLLALVGLIASARQAPRQTAILASFPVAYTVPLILASLLYVRYPVVAAPF